MQLCTHPSYIYSKRLSFFFCTSRIDTGGDFLSSKSRRDLWTASRGFESAHAQTEFLLSYWKFGRILFANNCLYNYTSRMVHLVAVQRLHICTYTYCIIPTYHCMYLSLPIHMDEKRKIGDQHNYCQFLCAWALQSPTLLATEHYCHEHTKNTANEWLFRKVSMWCKSWWVGRAQKKENDLKNLPDLSRDNDNVCVSCSGHSLPHLVISGLCRERGTLQLLVGILAELLLRPEGGKHCRQATQSNNHVPLHTDQNSILAKTAYGHTRTWMVWGSVSAPGPCPSPRPHSTPASSCHHT